MKRWLLCIPVLVLSALVLSASGAIAQGPGPQSVAGSQAILGTGFTYQGQLKQGGAMITSNCDMAFRLHLTSSDGGSVWNPITTTVPVTNSLFTVKLDFGGGVFTGYERWLGIQVRCPAGSGSWTQLTPLQELTPAPYALALPGLYTQQNATSPNLIGGYGNNWVMSGVKGAVIGGGGAAGAANGVSDDYGVVAGGYYNQAGDNAGTVSDRSYATVGGGYINRASATYATVSGGERNIASGNDAAVGGGNGNNASAWYTTIGGGRANATSSAYCTIGGGVDNVAGGNERATVGGGERNTASNWAATVPGGSNALASHYGEMAYASGAFADRGDAQASLYVMRAVTTDAGTWHNLYLDGSSARLTLAISRTVAFDILVVGRSDVTNEAAGYQIKGVINNSAGIVELLASQVTTLYEDDSAWNVRVNDVTDGALVVQAMGNGENIRWVATVRTAEVSW